MTQSPGPIPDVSKSRILRLCERYVSLAERHAGLLLLVAGILAALAALPVSKLELRTDMAELLPDNHPSVRALRSIAGRQKSATNLVLLIESPDGTANRRFLAALRPELDRLIPEVFTEIQWKPNSEIPEHAARWKWMYTDLKDLQKSEDLLDRIIANRKSPLLVDLEGDPEQELKDLRKQLDQKLPARNDSEYFSRDDSSGSTLGVMLWRRRDGIGSLGDHQTMRTVKETIARLHPESYHPQLRVRYTGHIAMAIDEQNAVRDDITVATTICTSLVLLAIYLYFQRVGLLVAIGAPAFYGVLLSLALAQFALKYLNINTAFLISIILGNGINTPIILLARYGEERNQGAPVGSALTRALARTMVATATAMLAASIAYGSLTITDFRGFNQFGLIGGAGMLLVWISTMFLVPPLVLLGERIRPGIFTPRKNLWRRPFLFIGQLVARHPVLIAILNLGLIFGAALPLSRYLRDPLEWNINNLRSDETESQKLWPKMEQMGMGEVGAGYIGNTGVLLVDTPDQADTVAEAMRAKDRALGKRHVLKTVRTIHSVLPTDQDAKLEILARIRQKLDHNRQMMSDEEWHDLQGFRPPEYLRRLTPDDLPRVVREAFTEVDNTRGRLIGIDADYENGYEDWNGHELLRLAEALKVDALGKTWVAASAGTVFGGMIETIHRDGPPVTLTALCGVVLLVLIMFGPRGALPVLCSLAVGVIWLGGMLGLLKIRLNFMNFIALPITLGIGTEYAANIWARLRIDGTQALATVIGDTGSAVALCSSTTIIGYSSLLLAHNQSLRSFGVAADLGEGTCLLAALIVLPVVVRALFRRSSQKAA